MPIEQDYLQRVFSFEEGVFLLCALLTSQYLLKQLPERLRLRVIYL
jgi:hypothetical protein